MKFPISMLRDFVETSLSAEQIGDLLTMAGFELEGIEVVGDEPVLDVKVVSNRGDGLSVMGLAREVLAKDPTAASTELFKRSASRFSAAQLGTPVSTRVKVESAGCNRYACSIYEGVSNGPSPDWVQTRLTQAGMRPISLLVDLTNYVMLEQGQPLHAFDMEKLDGGRIVVRDAHPGETLTTLNGEEHHLQPNQVMICDVRRPIAAAGVMGGIETEVSASTTKCLIESANFVNSRVRKARKQLGLSTDASYRFERSVDPELVVAALGRFHELLRQAGSDAVPTEFQDVYPSPPQVVHVELSTARASKLLGMEIHVDQAIRYLESLGFTVLPEADNLKVTVPTWRPDILREEDLIEELGRVHGYDRIPSVLPNGTTLLGGVTGFEAFVDAIRGQALRLGLVQTISHSLRDRHPLDEPQAESIGPRNPSAPDMAWLRSSLLPNLADCAVRNSGNALQLFEIGRTFRKGERGERIEFAVLLNGLPTRVEWQDKSESRADFFTLKSILEAVFLSVGARAHFHPEPGDPRLHPTRSAAIDCGRSIVGTLGQIEPETAAAAGLPSECQLATVRLDLLYAAAQIGVTKLKPVSRNPAVRRDIAVLIERTTSYAVLADAIASAVGDVLEKQWLFDVYAGANIPAGKHSLGIALQLRKLGANLTDEEANQLRERAVEAIVKLGGTTR